MDIKTFRDKANKKHANKYDYSKIINNVITHKDKVTIVCPIHGEFIQNVNSHLLRSECPECGKQKNINGRSKGKTHYTKRSNIAHNNKYDYSLLPQDVKATDKVTIICPTHGKFSQILNDHTRGHGCNKCARELVGEKTSKGLPHFLSRCQLIHGDKYTYDRLTPSVRIKDTVTIKCKKHGNFNQVLDAHLAGSGCPSCAKSNHVSKPEITIQQLLTKWGIQYIPSDRTLISPKEIDILIPSHNIAIEYCGLYWHSETNGKDNNYHKDKHTLCASRGYQLVTIFEDEWIYRRKQVIKKLQNLLHCSPDERIHARKCNIVSLDTATKQQFFEDNHIQGDGISSINIGLSHNEQIVAVIGFAKHKNGIYYLNRYATAGHVMGGFSKLFSYFKQQYKWNQIVSFADLRWSNGNMYNKNGWVLDSIIPPDYSYIKGNARFHKFNYRRKYLPKLLKNFDVGLSEKVNCDNNGILRIWDCGKQRWLLNNC